MAMSKRFLSTPSVWRATKCFDETDYIEEISIHALRVEGDAELRFAEIVKSISIHALRVEGDYSMLKRRRELEISIHALRVEGDSFTS